MDHRHVTCDFTPGWLSYADYRDANKGQITQFNASWTVPAKPKKLTVRETPARPPGEGKALTKSSLLSLVCRAATPPAGGSASRRMTATARWSNLSWLGATRATSGRSSTACTTGRTSRGIRYGPTVPRGISCELRTEPRAPSRNRRAGVQSPETYTVQPGDKIVSSISLSDPSQRAYTMRIKSITEPTKEIVWTYGYPTPSNSMQHAATTSL